MSKYRKKSGVAGPPRIAEKLFQMLLSRSSEEDLTGDLDEIYAAIQDERGRFRAAAWYWKQLFDFIPRVLNNSLFWSIVMLRNYLKIAVRNTLKQKWYSMINISGLALGIASCILILSYVHYQFSFDKFHAKSDRIYRVIENGLVNGKDYASAKIGPGLLPLFMEEFPEIETGARLLTDVFNMFRYEENIYYEPDFIYAEKEFFEVFSFRLIEGNTARALSEPNTVVLTESAVNRYFGNKDPMGGLIKFNDDIDLTVSGIIEDPPLNSHLQFSLVVSYETGKRYRETLSANLTYPASYTYILLNQNADPKALGAKFHDFYNRQFAEAFAKTGNSMTAALQHVESIHLHSNIQHDSPGNINIMYVYAFIVIAFAVLFIACINYVNLSTARSVVRAKEVGMRKVLGAHRGQVISQYIGESFFNGFTAFLLSAVIVYLALPAFRNISGTAVNISFLIEPVFIIEMAMLLVFVCLCAGAYPAFYLSRFAPAKTLKGQLYQGGGGSLRSKLVIIQMTLSIALIIVTAGIYNQMSYLKDKDLGFDKSDIIYLKFHNNHQDNENRIAWMNKVRSELTAISGVERTTLCNGLPMTIRFQDQLYAEGHPEDQPFNITAYPVGSGFLETMGIDLLEGRDFREEYHSDTNSVVISAATAKMLDWDEPIGKRLTFRWQDIKKDFYVIGVSEDLHSRTLHHEVEPVIFEKHPDFHILAVRLNPDDTANTLNQIKTKWQEMEPGHPFDYYFFEDTIDSMYRTENRIETVISVFTLLAILIGCLGLFGLVSYMTEQRTKEIGIRKSIGATELDIAALLSKSVVKWTLVANVLAWPAAYFSMNAWLNNFAYQSRPGLDLFILCGLAAVFISCLTISYQVIKTAFSNPVDALRYE